MASRVKRLTLTGGTAELHTRDAFKLLAKIPDETIDLLVTSPPYCMGMSYETSISAADFSSLHRRILPEVERVLRPGGSVCWQVGHHVQKGVSIPLDALVYSAAAEQTHLVLRNRIVWHFGHGNHSKRRFSGRHETILWFTKGENYYFDLDPVRVPQKYPGKRAYKGEKKGELSGNPLGKNPGDVWDIPNVKAKHPEKTEHPCQFPVAMIQRLVKSLSRPGDTVVDPFMGSGTTAVAAISAGRNFIGSDMVEDYVGIAQHRLQELENGVLAMRPDLPPRAPKEGEAVSQRPDHFAIPRSEDWPF